jgi:hypothetical protein
MTQVLIKDMRKSAIRFYTKTLRNLRAVTSLLQMSQLG